MPTEEEARKKKKGKQEVITILTRLASMPQTGLFFVPLIPKKKYQ